MLENKYEKIFNRFKEYYSYLYDQTVDWWPSGRMCITVKLEDGILMEFDYFDDSIRRIQPEQYTTDIEILRKNIGHNIKKVILSRSIPQSEIAQKCGITDAMLSRYIHGTSMPGIDKVHALAAVLGCRAIDIIGESYEN